MLLSWLAQIKQHLKPGISTNELSNSDFNSKLLNCFVFKTLCSKTKQLRSLFVKLLIDNIFADRSGLSFYQARQQ